MFKLRTRATTFRVCSQPRSTTPRLRLPPRQASYSPLCARLLSSAAPRPPTPSPPPLPTPAQRQPKLGLRPAPIKPKSSTASATNIPLKPTKPLPHPTAVPHAPSLGEVKLAAKHDIEDAVAHGILAPPPPNANWFRRTLHQGIQLAKFYYHGVKLIFIRRKHINLIHARIKAGGSPLSRREFRLIRTQKDDINKVVPFLFIALLLEEVIPLIAIYAPFMLPSTCILPSQRDRIEEKRTEKAIAFATDYRHIYAQMKLKESPAGHLPLEALKEAGASIAICGVLGLSTVGFDALRIRRIRKHLEFLIEDDKLLIQGNLITRLSPKRLKEALQERGILTHNLSPKSMEAQLKWWLDSVSQSDSTTKRLHLLVNRL
ncbi:LETM1 and EF-hand domain-containing protein 1, mitochondrial [Hypsizygus marmoreus]|uniref:LETM1 and EF-hand domain-containing protein 1, mitochondrial n=1 Tax=Hypsizygus marmoreus TaxID=39966 RepID=A0A369JYD8_HYPMA|nr:LETM1 and EF-hand domain-containing protein 1, mitochondrial [Hypsizygus marmoreus]